MAVLTILMTGAAHRQAVDPAPPATMTKRPCRARIRLPAEPGIGSLWVTDPGPAPVSAVPPIWALCRRSSPAMDWAHNVVICVLPGAVALAH